MTAKLYEKEHAAYADDNGKHAYKLQRRYKKYFTIIIISIHVHITPRVLVKSPFHLVSVSEVQYHVRFLKTRFTSSTRANGLPQKKLKAEAISSPPKKLQFKVPLLHALQGIIAG